MTFRLLPAARRDLATIWDYSAAAYGQRQADDYIAAINAAFVRLAEAPGIGSPAGIGGNDYRKYPVFRHRLIYRTHGQAIIIVRVIHERMDHVI